MRSKLLVISALTLLCLAACGASPAAVQRPTAPTPATAGVEQAQATAAPATRIATPAPTEPMEETSMPTQPPATPEPQPTQPPATPRPTFQAAPITQATASPPTPATAPPPRPTLVAPGLAAQIDSAKADLARRRSVSADAIGVVEASSVVWPDGSLGCPQPGRAYPQIQIEGLLIRLSIGDQVFEYHGGGGKPLFLCEQKP
jgi:hypothetical protein